VANEVPEGAAVFPIVPEELGIHPLLLAVLHAVVFLEGSDPRVVQPEAAEEQLELIAAALQRLKGEDLRRIREDLIVLADFARREGWDKSAIVFVKSFLKNYGVEKSE
jgi:hypothetical protein